MQNENQVSKVKTESAANELLAIATRLEFFHDQRGDCYALVDGRNEQVSNSRFKEWLAAECFRKSGKIVGSESLKNVCRLLESKARRGPKKELHVRIAQISNDHVWIDLTDKDNQAISVTPLGWSIIKQTPPLFRRFSHQQPLSAPINGGNIHKLFHFLNLASVEDQILVITWLATAYVESISHPIMLLHGTQGSAKTTAAKILRSLIDPSLLDAGSLPSRESELAQILDHHYVPVFDNITHISDAQANTLCRAATGGGFSKRGLYSDADDVIFQFRRPMILTCINLPTRAPDLLDRALLVNLERISPDRRRPEAEVMKDLAVAHPLILGAILETISQAMRVFPILQVPQLPRMADFARWGAAVAQVLGYGAQEFICTVFRNANQQSQEVVEDHIVARLMKNLAKQGHWKGTPTELLNTLKEMADLPAKGDHGFPHDAAKLGREINKVKSALADVGVEVLTGHKEHGDRIIEITLSDPAAIAVFSNISRPQLFEPIGNSSCQEQGNVLANTVHERPLEEVQGQQETNKSMYLSEENDTQINHLDIDKSANPDMTDHSQFEFNLKDDSHEPR